MGTQAGIGRRFYEAVCDRLVYYEVLPTASAAIAREKQIKSWRRSKKIDLIRSMNPRWTDLAEEWYEDPNVSRQGPDPSLRSG